MSYIKANELKNNNILRINSEKNNIDTDPEYQRRGEIWNLEKRQLLIDSIINDYDIPKLYFHLLDEKQKKKKKTSKDYAIIDGRQRIETIWSFIDGDFALADDFKLLRDPSLKLAGLTYPEISKRFPNIKIHFDSTSLPIMIVETDDLDLIEDMFSRLNEAVPLNAAEKRNAFGGPMAQVIRDISNHKFFADKLRISDTRFQHREISARLIFLEYSLDKQSKIIDTKKPYLDAMVKYYRTKTTNLTNGYKSLVLNVLNEMNKIFSKKDKLLASQSIIPIYYLLFRSALKQQKLDLISRKKFLDFNQQRTKNREIAQIDITKANFDLIEFDRLSVQGTNDASSIRERVRILGEHLKLKNTF